MIEKYTARAIQMEVDGEVITGIEFPIEAIEKFDLKNNQILEVFVSDDSENLTIKKTKYIYNENI